MLKGSRTLRQKDIKRLVRDEPASYVIFDILEKDGNSLTKLPLLERKAILKQSVAEGRYCCLADFIEGQGESYFGVVAAHGLEGVVAKKKDSAYEEGNRSDCWLKIKKPAIVLSLVTLKVKAQPLGLSSLDCMMKN